MCAVEGYTLVLQSELFDLLQELQVAFIYIFIDILLGTLEFATA